MLTVIPSGDCGNSPKNQFVETFTIAMAQQDEAFLLASVTDDVTWRIVGQPAITGKAAFSKALGDQPGSVSKIRITHVLTHGKVGAVNGTCTHEDGTMDDFCVVYEFGNAKATTIRTIKAYVVEGAGSKQRS